MGKINYIDPVTKEKWDYDKFYAEGGWTYNPEHQMHFIKTKVVEPIGLKPCKLLEIGCGMGMTSNIFTQLGFDVTGTDISKVAIDSAKATYPDTKYIAGDTGKLEFDNDYDVILARGMSWYHYKLNEINRNGIDVPKETERLFGFLKSGGLFILIIATDFSGNTRLGGNSLSNHLWEYQKLFQRFGEIVFCSDYKGKKLNTEEDTKGAISIIIATRKP